MALIVPEGRQTGPDQIHSRSSCTWWPEVYYRNDQGKGKNKTPKHPNQKGILTSNTSNTYIITCKNCGRTGHWVKDCWRPGGGAYDNSGSNNNNTNKGKGKQVDVVETNQSSETASTVSYPSQTPSTIHALWCDPEVEQKGWIIGVTLDSMSFFNKETSWWRVFAS